MATDNIPVFDPNKPKKAVTDVPVFDPKKQKKAISVNPNDKSQKVFDMFFEVTPSDKSLTESRQAQFEKAKQMFPDKTDPKIINADKGLGYAYNQVLNESDEDWEVVRKFPDPSKEPIVSVGNELLSASDFANKYKAYSYNIYNTYSKTGNIQDAKIDAKVMSDRQYPAVFELASNNTETTILESRILEEIETSAAQKMPGYKPNVQAELEKISLLPVEDSETLLMKFKDQGFRFENAQKAFSNIIDANRSNVLRQSAKNNIQKKYGITDPKDPELAELVSNNIVKKATDRMSTFNKELYDYYKEYQDLLIKKPEGWAGRAEQIEDILMKAGYDPEKDSMYDILSGKPKQQLSEGQEVYYSQVAEELQNIEQNVSYKDELEQLFLNRGLEFMELEKKYNEAETALARNMYSPESKASAVLYGTENEYAKTKRYRDHLYNLYHDAKVKFDAVSKMYLLNKDATQRDANFVHWMENAGLSVIGGVLGTQFTNSNIGTSRYDKFQAINDLYHNREIRLSDQQVDNIKRRFFQEATQAAGGLVGIAIEFGLLNKFQAATGLPALLEPLKKGSALEKATFHIANLLMEEAKFRTIGGMPTAGAAFYGTQQLLPNIRIKGKYGAILNPFVNAMYKTDVGMTLAGETSELFAGAVDELYKDGDIEKVISEHFGDYNEFGRRMALGLSTNWLFGVHGLMKKNIFVTNPESLGRMAKMARSKGDIPLANQLDAKSAIISESLDKLRTLKQRADAPVDAEGAKKLRKEAEIEKSKGEELKAAELISKAEKLEAPTEPEMSEFLTDEISFLENKKNKQSKRVKYTIDGQSVTKSDFLSRIKTKLKGKEEIDYDIQGDEKFAGYVTRLMSREFRTKNIKEAGITPEKNYEFVKDYYTFRVGEIEQKPTKTDDELTELEAIKTIMPQLEEGIPLQDIITDLVNKRREIIAATKKGLMSRYSADEGRGLSEEGWKEFEKQIKADREYQMTEKILADKLDFWGTEAQLKHKTERYMEKYKSAQYAESEADDRAKKYKELHPDATPIDLPSNDQKKIIDLSKRIENGDAEISIEELAEAEELIDNNIKRIDAQLENPSIRKFSRRDLITHKGILEKYREDIYDYQRGIETRETTEPVAPTGEMKPEDIKTFAGKEPTKSEIDEQIAIGAIRIDEGFQLDHIRKKDFVQKKESDDGFTLYQVKPKYERPGEYAVSSSSLVKNGKVGDYNYRIKFDATPAGEAIGYATVSYESPLGHRIERPGDMGFPKFNYSKLGEIEQFIKDKIGGVYEDNRMNELMKTKTRFGNTEDFFTRTVEEENALFDQKINDLNDRIAIVDNNIAIINERLEKIYEKRQTGAEIKESEDLNKELDELRSKRELLQNEFSKDQETYDEAIRLRIYKMIREQNLDVPQDQFFKIRDEIVTRIYQTESLSNQFIEDIIADEFSKHPKKPVPVDAQQEFVDDGINVFGDPDHATTKNSDVFVENMTVPDAIKKVKANKHRITNIDVERDGVMHTVRVNFSDKKESSIEFSVFNNQGQLESLLGDLSAFMNNDLKIKYKVEFDVVQEPDIEKALEVMTESIENFKRRTGSKRSNWTIAHERMILDDIMRKIVNVDGSVFTHVDEGIYSMTSPEGRNYVFIMPGLVTATGDQLSAKKIKADYLFIDVPNVPVVKKHSSDGTMISMRKTTPDDFYAILQKAKPIFRSADTPVVFSYNKAAMNRENMELYSDVIKMAGFKPIGMGAYITRESKGKYLKTYPSRRESLMIFSLSGKTIKTEHDPKLDFKIVKPKAQNVLQNIDDIIDLMTMTEVGIGDEVVTMVEPKEETKPDTEKITEIDWKDATYYNLKYVSAAEYTSLSPKLPPDWEDHIKLPSEGESKEAPIQVEKIVRKTLYEKKQEWRDKQTKADNEASARIEENIRKQGEWAANERLRMQEFEKNLKVAKDDYNAVKAEVQSRLNSIIEWYIDHFDIPEGFTREKLIALFSPTKAFPKSGVPEYTLYSRMYSIIYDAKHSEAFEKFLKSIGATVEIYTGRGNKFRNIHSILNISFQIGNFTFKFGSSIEDVAEQIRTWNHKSTPFTKPRIEVDKSGVGSSRAYDVEVPIPKTYPDGTLKPKDVYLNDLKKHHKDTEETIAFIRSKGKELTTALKEDGKTEAQIKENQEFKRLSALLVAYDRERINIENIIESTKAKAETESLLPGERVAEDIAGINDKIEALEEKLNTIMSIQYQLTDDPFIHQTRYFVSEIGEFATIYNLPEIKNLILNKIKEYETRREKLLNTGGIVYTRPDIETILNETEAIEGKINAAKTPDELDAAEEQIDFLISSLNYHISEEIDRLKHLSEDRTQFDVNSIWLSTYPVADLKRLRDQKVDISFKDYQAIVKAQYEKGVYKKMVNDGKISPMDVFGILKGVGIELTKDSFEYKSAIRFIKRQAPFILKGSQYKELFEKLTTLDTKLSPREIDDMYVSMLVEHYRSGELDRLMDTEQIKFHKLIEDLRNIDHPDAYFIVNKLLGKRGGKNYKIVRRLALNDDLTLLRGDAGYLAGYRDDAKPDGYYTIISNFDQHTGKVIRLIEQFRNKEYSLPIPTDFTVYYGETHEAEPLMVRSFEIRPATEAEILNSFGDKADKKAMELQDIRTEEQKVFIPYGALFSTKFRNLNPLALEYAIKAELQFHKKIENELLPSEVIGEAAIYLDEFNFRKTFRSSNDNDVSYNLYDVAFVDVMNQITRSAYEGLSPEKLLDDWIKNELPKYRKEAEQVLAKQKAEPSSTIEPTREQKIADDLSNLINDSLDILDKFKKTSRLLPDEKATSKDALKLAENATKIVGKMFELGVYKLSDIVKKLSERVTDKLLKDYLPYLRNAYKDKIKLADEKLMDRLERLDDVERVDDVFVDNLYGRVSKKVTPVSPNEPTPYERMKESMIRGDFKSYADLQSFSEKHKLDFENTKKLFERAYIETTRKAIKNGKSLTEIYEKLIAQSKDQHIFGSYNRSQRMESRPTPPHLAFMMGRFINVENIQSVFDPNAGSGMSSIAGDPGIFTMNNSSLVHEGTLKDMRIGTVITSVPTEPYHLNDKFDGIMVNTIQKVKPVNVIVGGNRITQSDHLIALRGLENMNSNGKAAVMIAGENHFDKDGNFTGADKEFMSHLFSNYNVADIITVAGNLYYPDSKNPFRIILINGKKPVVSSKVPMKADINNTKVSRELELFERFIHKINSPNENLLRSTEDVDTGTGTITGGGTSPGGKKPKSSRPPRVPDGESGEPDTGRTGKKPKVAEPTAPDDGGDTGITDTGGELPGGTGVGGRKGGFVPPPAEPTETKGGRTGRTIRTGEEATVPADNNLEDTKPLTAEQLIKSVDGRISYIPYSKGKRGKMFVPVSMVYHLKESFDKLVKEIGKDVDTYVMEELGYKDLNELDDALMAEQIDALALAIYNNKRGYGTIIGDDTGLGKGRVAASMIRWAKKNNTVPVFVTENVQLFSDFYRDLKGIMSQDLKPFIVNATFADGREAAITEEVLVTQKDGTVVAELQTVHRHNKEDYKKAITEGKVPEGYDFLLTTYSQFQNAETDLPRRNLLQNTAKDSFIVMDECHNASGVDSNTSQFFVDVLGGVKGSTMLSATFAKRPDNFALYHKTTSLRDLDMDIEILVDALQTGGEVIQEVISKQLTSAGQLIARQKDYAGVTVNYKTIGTDVSDKQTSDKIIKDYEEITGRFYKLIEFQNLTIKDYIKEYNEKNKGQSSMRGQSPYQQVFNVVNQLLFSLKAPTIAKMAIDRHKAGHKVCIAINNTMESMFSDYLQPEFGKEVNTNFMSMLERALDKAMMVTIRYKNDPEVYRERVSNPMIEAMAQELLSSFKNAAQETAHITISPIDQIRRLIENEGFTISEITGRVTRIAYEGNDFTKGKYVKRNDFDKVNAVHKWNNGELDFLILNRAGSTGISMHSDKNFKHTGKRCMIVHQFELDVAKEKQKRGRVHRYGQLSDPVYDYVTSDIPAEKRIFMMMVKKLKSLDANTLSDQTLSKGMLDTELASIEDIMNSIGDHIVAQHIQNNPYLNDQIHDPFGINKKDSAKHPPSFEDAVKKVTNRIAVLPIRDQKEFYESVMEAYRDKVEELKQGYNFTLEANYEDLKAVTKKALVFTEGSHKNSVFGEDSILETVEVDRTNIPFKISEIDKDVKKSLGVKTKEEHAEDLISVMNKFIAEKTRERIGAIDSKYDTELSDVKKRLDKSLADGLYTKEQYEAALEGNKKAINHNRNNAKSELMKDFAFKEYVQTVLRTLKIGDVVRIPGRHEQYGMTAQKDVFGIVTGILINSKLKNPYAPSAIKYKIATTGEYKTIVLPISKSDFKSVYDANVFDGRNKFDEAGADDVRKKWDTMIPTRTRELRYMVTGNLLPAIGELRNVGFAVTVYSTEDGKIQVGLKTPHNYDPEGRQKIIKVPIVSAIDVLDRQDAPFSLDGENGSFQIKKRNLGTRIAYELIVSPDSAIGKSLLEDKESTQFFDGKFEKISNNRVVEIKSDKVNDYIKHIQKKFGTQIVIDSKYLKGLVTETDEKLTETIKKQNEEKKSGSFGSEGGRFNSESSDPGLPENSYDNLPDAVSEFDSPLMHFENPHNARAKTPRIEAAPIQNTDPNVEQMSTIIADFKKKMKMHGFYRKKTSKSKNAIGTYYPGQNVMYIKYENDVDTWSHEMGHNLDSLYSIVGQWSNSLHSPYDNELKKFWVWGSRPPKQVVIDPNTGMAKYVNADPMTAATYLRAEGVAEFLRAYVLNPEATRYAAPLFYEYFENILPDHILQDIRQFGDRVRRVLGNSNVNRLLSHIDPGGLKKPGIFSFRNHPRMSHMKNDEWGFTFWDNVAYWISDRLGFAKAAYNHAVKALGLSDDILPIKDFNILVSLFSNVGGSVDDMFRNGLRDANKNLLTDGGNPMNFAWLMGAFRGDSPEALTWEMKLAIVYGLSQRVVAKSDQLNNMNLAGWSFGIGTSDYALAKKAIAEIENLDPERFARIEEAVRRYRKWADANLRYLVDGGRMTEQQYQFIKNRNDYYFAMNRVLENSPDGEIKIYDVTRVGGKDIVSYAEPIKTLKGSSKIIRNPYESLVDQTYSIVRETERNRVLASFVDVFDVAREMYGSNPSPLGDIATRVLTKANNKTDFEVWRNGEREVWRTDPLVMKSIHDISGMDAELNQMFKVAAFMPQLMRKSVVNSPFFPMLNTCRDTFHRLVISSTEGDPIHGITDMLPSKFVKTFGIDQPLTSADLRLYGGDFSSWYMKDKFNYYRLMYQTMHESINQGHIIIDPIEWAKKGYKGYMNYVQHGETANRLAEFRSAYRHATETLGFDDHNAKMYAAYKSRELIDFAVAGKAIYYINQIIPFTNPAIQGVKAVSKAIKNNPAQVGIQFLGYVLVPSLSELVMAKAFGYKDEYIQQPGYFKDLYWNYRIAPNLWLRIPKPFELGVVAGAVNRGLSGLILGDMHPYQGYVHNLLSSLVPLNVGTEVVSAFPLMPYKWSEALIYNYDSFREKNVVPDSQRKLSFEAIKRGSERGRFDRYASNLGLMMSEVFRTDARKIDHIIKSQFTYFGDYAMRLSDIGRTDKRGSRFGITTIPFFKNSPVSNARDVLWVEDKLTKEGLIDEWGRSKVSGWNNLRALVDNYYDAKTSKEKDAIGKEIRTEAVNLRKQIETEGLSQYY